MYVLVRQYQEPISERIVEHHACSVREFREPVSDWTFSRSQREGISDEIHFIREIVFLSAQRRMIL